VATLPMMAGLEELFPSAAVKISAAAGKRRT
jgi:hypothetical protein